MAHHEVWGLLEAHRGAYGALRGERGGRNALPAWVGDGRGVLSIYFSAPEVRLTPAPRASKFLGWAEMRGDLDGTGDQTGGGVGVSLRTLTFSRRKMPGLCRSGAEGAPHPISLAADFPPLQCDGRGGGLAPHCWDRGASPSQGSFVVLGDAATPEPVPQESGGKSEQLGECRPQSTPVNIHELW